MTASRPHSSGSSPTALRVLAVLNLAFVIAGVLLVYETLALWPDTLALGPKGRYEGPAKGNIYMTACLVGACIVLLIVSARGYLQASSARGRRLGNAFATLALTATHLRWLLLDDAIGAVEIAFAGYAAVTLMLINTVLKKQFDADSGASSSSGKEEEK